MPSGSSEKKCNASKYCVNKSRLMYAISNTFKRDRVNFKVFDTCMHVYSPSPYSNFRVILKKVSIYRKIVYPSNLTFY